MVSDFSKNRWAVISERGCEETDLAYEEARRLVHRLAGEGRHGLCIITNETASHLPTAANQSNEKIISSSA